MTAPAAARGLVEQRPGAGDPPDRGSFPAIGDLAFLSDGEVGALVAPSGNVEWLCLPALDSPSVFGALLDRGAGRFRVGPSGVQVPAGQRYLLGSMVVETTWMTGTGFLVVRDALTLGPWRDERRGAQQRRPPGDTQAEQVLIRTMKCVQGSVEVTLDCEPMFDYGRKPARWSHLGAGHHAACAAPDDGAVARPRERRYASRSARSSRSRGATQRRRRASTRPSAASRGRRSTGAGG